MKVSVKIGCVSMLMWCVACGGGDPPDASEPVTDMSVTTDMVSQADLAGDMAKVQDMGDEAPDQAADLDQVVEDLGTEEDMAQDMLGDEDMLGEEDMSADMSSSYPPVSEDPLGGDDRPATLHVPEGFDNSRQLPLVVALHGYTSNGFQIGEYFRLAPKVDEKDFILITPDGTRDARGQQFWNATDACCDGFNTGVDDLGYIRGLIEEAKARFNIDAGRVYVMGHSNGGFMSFRMACEASDIITGIVSLAGATYKDESACSPSEPVHIIQMHGTNDPTISYEGGNAYPTAPPYPGAVETVETWAAYNSCDAELSERVVFGESAATSLTLTIEGHNNCAPQGSSELWTIRNGNHVPVLPSGFGDVMLGKLFAQDRTP